MRPTLALLLATAAVTVLAVAPASAAETRGETMSRLSTGKKVTDSDKEKAEKEKAEAAKKEEAEKDKAEKDKAEKELSEKAEDKTDEKAEGKVVVLAGDCSLYKGCLFTGDDANGDEIASAYDSFFPKSGLSLAFQETVEFKEGVFGGEWFSKNPISFFSVQAGDEFILYRLEKETTSGSWSTDGLFGKKGQTLPVSHLSFWSGGLGDDAGSDARPAEAALPVPALEEPPPVIEPLDSPLEELPGAGGLSAAVPEPATWIMMILGFGMLGAELRRRRAVLSA